MHRIDPRIVIIQIVLSGICAFWIFKPLAIQPIAGTLKVPLAKW